MKKILIIIFLLFFIGGFSGAHAQCSICTRTAQQLGERPAKGMNGGILYLAFAPFAIVGIVAFRYYKSRQSS